MMNVAKKPRKSKKYIFVLNNINVEKIKQKYGITIISNLTNNEQPLNTTKLSELNDITNSGISNETISFLDETKRLFQCNISMIDFSTSKDIKTLKYNCFWDRHSFNTEPIGCPIRYVSNKGVKSYFSEISKDKYLIKENITYHKKKLLNSQQNFVFIPIKSNSSRITIDENEYYETDGIFCSFNCCQAFINENKHNPLYEQSTFLLNKIFNEYIKSMSKDKDQKIKKIVPAAHWRLLLQYGGDKTILEFRETFNKNEYILHDTVFLRNKFKPVATLFEEKINF
jgi:hypothetical protein